MLNDKKTLALLILFAVYIFGVKPVYDKLPFMVLELKNLKKAVAKEEFLLTEQKKIKEMYPKLLKKIDKNKSLFFTEQTPTSSAMSSIQSYIKKVSLQSGVRLVNISWGSPVKKKGYVVLFVSFSGRGLPFQFESFLRGIYLFKKLVRFESISVYATPYSSELSFNGIIKCFKLSKGVEVEKK